MMPVTTASEVDGNERRLPDEVLMMVFHQLKRDPKTLMLVASAVCRRWRRVCAGLREIELDFRWAQHRLTAAGLTGVICRFSSVRSLNLTGCRESQMRS